MRHSIHIEAAVAGMIEAMQNPAMLPPRPSETYGAAASRVRSWCKQVLKRKDEERRNNTQLVRDRVSDGHGIIQHLCEQRPDLAAKWIIELVILARLVRYEGMEAPKPGQPDYDEWKALDTSLERWAGLIAWDDEPAGGHRFRRNELERVLKLGIDQ